MNSNFVTLTKFLLAEQNKVPEATGEFTQLVNAIQTAIKVISSAVRRAGLLGLFGSVGEQGDDFKKLDVLANELFINLLKSSNAVALLVSHGNDTVIQVEADKRGKYVVTFDPLDGSSNVSCQASIGSIFSIMTKIDSNSDPSENDALQPGSQVIAAGYALYGSATMIVLSLGGSVNGFILDDSVGEFILKDPDIQIPTRGDTYSINESYSYLWDDSIKVYIESKKDPAKGKPYNARYIGTMVADVHRTMKKGGIFVYPATSTETNGKLGLLYECIPMAFLVVKAGGLASNGETSILDIKPTSIHQKSPIFIGSKEDVEEIVEGISSNVKCDC